MKTYGINALQTRFPIAKTKELHYHILRKLLLAWIRPQVLGDDVEKLTLESGRPVCYVLPNRSLTDLLVVDDCCEKADLPRPHSAMDNGFAQEGRSFFFLAHTEGRFFKRTSARNHSPRLLRIMDALTANRSMDVQLVPVSLFWGHAPERERSLFKLLLSDNWAVTSGFKKMLALIFQHNHIVVQYSKPISLRALIDGEMDDRRRVRKLSRILRVHFRRQKQAILGPDLSHRRTMLDSLLSSTSVRAAILDEAKRSNVSLQSLEAIARNHANEIAAHQSYRVIRFFCFLLTWFWHKIYNGIVVENVERVQELALRHEIVYVPCHRSHVDYLLLSYVLYLNGLTPPHIAAGKNMNLALVGPLLRRGGAFFMRRSFQDDQLYRAVFDEYLHMTFIKGYSVEYFIEGGRSRTGRMLRPRTGMLSMTVRSFQRNSSLPIAFMPVYLGYEKILEAGTYLGELKGKEKTDESLGDIFRVLRSLPSSFGTVNVNFGQPIYLTEFLDGTLPGWEDPASIDKNHFSAACYRLGHEITTSINRAAAVNPVNLVALILLATPKQTIEETSLKQHIEVLLKLLRSVPLCEGITVTHLSVDEIIEQVEKISLIQRATYPYGDILSVQGDAAILMTYYRNNISHLLALPSLIGRLIKTDPGLTLDSLLGRASRLYPFLKSEFFLPWSLHTMESICQHIIDAMVDIGLAVRRGSSLHSPPPMTPEFASLTVLAQIIEPTLQRFFIACSLLNESHTLSLTKDLLESACHNIARNISALYGINAPEFFERSLFSTFLATLAELKKLETTAGILAVSEDFDQISAAIDPILESDFRYGVLQALRHITTESTTDTHQTDLISLAERS
jgi:glycerol-3-phosphate O-acyltransferase|tara:strand:+ start:3325 stop:5868 length:2544 start_codon:yes stop_codon:yes gene_type:complete